MPWSRSNEQFIRRWLVLTDIPMEAGSSVPAPDSLASFALIERLSGIFPGKYIEFIL